MGKNKATKLTAHFEDTNARQVIGAHLMTLLGRQEGINARHLIVLCIGSDRYTGDALGPLVGSYLKEHTDYTVYGCLDHPVHAGNLVETINIINNRYHHPLIIAVDACLGKASEIGNIEVWEGGLEAGIAVGNRLPCVGNISIIGVVNAGGKIGYLDLQSTPLSIVMKLSKIIATALEDALKMMAMPTASVSG
ncbi:protein of unknown function DUF1256 [Thermosinus carboxydivorans Nor1]|uniref:Sporulation protein YyaC n=2 Tax=Sporomusaceae TaxID=1843490 RepID=A1HQ43_9FIRM|nr:MULTISPECIES: spore protease YyaC [Sporomusaceae]EAX47892.1 protein of unknown function DUF1256 [Thermosinus carboxydivorans Nor1]SDF09343.1 putative sporulation protein YyaC [Sporolituus thermophilus DSM 23256]